ncbi:MAG: hypothetical protein HY720_18810 [Planctomycetes bacterium]|nr:hypothetical protein [Planctomycetota bacterium]
MNLREVCLGITGSVAIHRGLDLASGLVKEGVTVRVVMSQAATRLVSPEMFRAVSGRPVLVDLFEPAQAEVYGHIEQARSVDLAIVAPATANVLGKVAAGIADDALTTVLLTLTCPIWFAPAMNTRMYANRIVQRNVQTLRDAGYRILEPEEGRLACGDVGVGRMAAVERILDELRAFRPVGP